MNCKAKNYGRILMIFALCTLALSIRDILFKQLFDIGITISQVLFYVGIFSFFTSVIYSGFKKEQFFCNDISFQIWRILIVAISAFFAFKSFELLSPTIVNIGSKMTMPLMIVFSSIIGLSYGKTEKIIAIFTIIILAIFFMLLTNIYGITWGSLSILLISTVAMIAEFLALNKTVKTDSSVLISTVPSISLILVGYVLSMVTNTPLLINSVYNIILLFICGTLYFSVYYSGKIRYKLLPPGLAEYPSLMTIVFVWPLDAFIFNNVPSIMTLLSGFVALIMIAIIIYLHTKKVTHDLI